MATLRLFASARLAAGTRTAAFDEPTVGALLDAAVERFGENFDVVLANSKVWCNGEPCGRQQPISSTDEIAVLPPVSGG